MKHRNQVMTNHRRHAQTFNADGDITYGEWYEVLQRYGNVCLRCGTNENLSPDHIVPLSRGGTNTIGNIQPLCVTCNLSKNATTVDYRDGKAIDKHIIIPEFIETGYKSLKIPFAAWQVLTRITAHTGEPRSAILVRLIHNEAQRLLGKDADQDTIAQQTTTTKHIAE